MSKLKYLKYKIKYLKLKHKGGVYDNGYDWIEDHDDYYDHHRHGLGYEDDTEDDHGGDYGDDHMDVDGDEDNGDDCNGCKEYEEGDNWVCTRAFTDDNDGSCHWIFESTDDRNRNIDGHLIKVGDDYYPHTTLRASGNTCHYGYDTRDGSQHHWGCRNEKLRKVNYKVYGDFYNFLCQSGYFRGQYEDCN